VRCAKRPNSRISQYYQPRFLAFLLQKCQLQPQPSMTSPVASVTVAPVNCASQAYSIPCLIRSENDTNLPDDPLIHVSRRHEVDFRVRISKDIYDYVVSLPGHKFSVGRRGVPMIFCNPNNSGTPRYSTQQVWFNRSATTETGCRILKMHWGLEGYSKKAGDCITASLRDLKTAYKAQLLVSTKREEVVNWVKI